MIAHHSDFHVKMVDTWEKKNTSGLAFEIKTQLFIKAIQAVEQRTLMTLSNVTLSAILDRVLNQSTDRFPILTEVRIGIDGLNFEELLNKSKHTKPEELLEALRFVLIELISVLGSITADILTTALQKELTKVTSNSQKSSTKHVSEER